MSMMIRDPFDALMPLRDAMNRLIEESFIGPRFEFWAGRAFPVDVCETEDKMQYVVKASLPGVKLEELQITAVGDMLTISVVKKHEEKVEKGNYLRHERFEGEMSRTISLPSFIEVEKVEATFEHGVLTLHIPKAESAKPKQITVKVKELAGAR